MNFSTIGSITSSPTWHKEGDQLFLAVGFEDKHLYIIDVIEKLK